jgi:hypothetical protein
MDRFVLGFVLGVVSVFVAARLRRAVAQLRRAVARELPASSAPVTLVSTDVATVLRGMH